MDIVETQYRRRPSLLSLVLLTVAGLGLYLGFLSTSYDPNGVIEAEAVERDGAALFSPNHILYRPLVRLVGTSLGAAGYEDRSIVFAQITAAVFGALGMGLFYWWLRPLINHEVVAVLVTLGFGTSWAYWVFSTDAYYIVLAATCIIGMFILLAVIWTTPQLQPSPGLLVGAGILCALSILFWQADIFIVPVVWIGLLVTYRASIRRLLVGALLFSMPIAIVVGGVYVYVGAFILGHSSTNSFLDWFLHYGARLSMWGRWDITRLFELVKSALASLVPLWEGLGLRALLRGEFHADKIIIQIALVALALLLLLPLLGKLRRRPLISKTHMLGWLLLVYLIYLPFITWWDPFEPKWFVIPNIGLWTILALLWDSMVIRPRQAVILGGLIVSIATANFSATVWPRHSTPNINLVKAKCVAEHLAAEDLLVSAEWGEWAQYVSYFFHRQVFSIIDASARYSGTEEVFNRMQQEIAAVQQRGGRIYTVEFATFFSPEALSWLTSQTGLTQEDFQRFEGTPAFVCDGTRFQEISLVR